jgi:hypothetical protein
MSCILTFGVICLLETSSFTLSADVSQPIQQPLYEGAWCGNEKIGHYCQGPRVELSLGLSVTLSERFTADYGLRHSSYIAESDRGVESVFVRVTWRPGK